MNLRFGGRDKLLETGPLPGQCTARKHKYRAFLGFKENSEVIGEKTFHKLQIMN
jgi:hypothetical protein